MKTTPSKWFLGTDYDAYVEWLAEEAAEDPRVSVYTLPYGTETYELGNVSESLKYALGAMQEVDETYTQNTFKTGDRIKNQLQKI